MARDVAGVGDVGQQGQLAEGGACGDGGHELLRVRREGA